MSSIAETVQRTLGIAPALSSAELRGRLEKAKRDRQALYDGFGALSFEAEVQAPNESGLVSTWQRTKVGKIQAKLRVATERIEQLSAAVAEAEARERDEAQYQVAAAYSRAAILSRGKLTKAQKAAARLEEGLKISADAFRDLQDSIAEAQNSAPQEFAFTSWPRFAELGIFVGYEIWRQGGIDPLNPKYEPLPGYAIPMGFGGDHAKVTPLTKVIDGTVSWIERELSDQAPQYPRGWGSAA